MVDNFLHILFFAMGVVFVVLFPSGWQVERTVRFTLTRVVAGGATWGNLQLVAFAVPYRPNRTYYRLAIARL